jgi:hypothetical protein
MKDIDMELMNYIFSNQNMKRYSESQEEIIDIKEKDFIRATKKLFKKDKKFRKMVFKRIAKGIQEAYLD